jgi:hypothetical protein
MVAPKEGLVPAVTRATFFARAWPDAAFLILALSGNLALLPSGPPHQDALLRR